MGVADSHRSRAMSNASRLRNIFIAYMRLKQHTVSPPHSYTFELTFVGVMSPLRMCIATFRCAGSQIRGGRTPGREREASSGRVVVCVVGEAEAAVVMMLKSYE